ncbi:hypothetical protein GCM10023148_14420 [Actinokineospora soli]
MDAELTQLMTAFPLEEHQAREWYELLRTAHDNEPNDFDAFLARVRDESGHIVDEHEIERLLEEMDRVGGERMDLVRRLVEHDPAELAEAHRMISSGEEPAGHAAEHQAADPAARFDWVPAEIAQRLESEWGHEWQTALGEQLDYRWGEGWEQHPDDDKAAWLPDVLAELLDGDQQQADPADPATRFDWVPAEIAERLSSAWGQDWQTPLGQQLDYRWGEGWEQHPDDHKAAWLPDLVDELLAPADEIPDQPGAPAEPAAATPEPAGAGDFSAEDIKSAVDEVLAEVPGAENLSEEELRQIRAQVAAALAAEGAPAAQ